MVLPICRYQRSLGTTAAECFRILGNPLRGHSLPCLDLKSRGPGLRSQSKWLCNFEEISKQIYDLALRAKKCSALLRNAPLVSVIVPQSLRSL